MRTMFFRMISPTYLVVHGPVPPTAPEWNEYLSDMEDNLAAMTGIFVTTVGGGTGPNAGQRKQVADLWKRNQTARPIAVVTSMLPSRRAIVTALNWLLPQPVRTFEPANVHEAYAYLAVPPLTRANIESAVGRFAEELGVPFRSFE